MRAGPPAIRIKRVYEPAVRSDGRRILVERLWPRGMTKESVAMDAWAREVAPSTQLRRWFGHQVARWDEFARRYRAELDANPAAWQPLLAAAQRAGVTLLYSARDPAHNGALVLCRYLAARLATPSRASPRGSRAGTGAAAAPGPRRRR